MRSSNSNSQNSSSSPVELTFEQLQEQLNPMLALSLSKQLDVVENYYVKQNEYDDSFFAILLNKLLEKFFADEQNQISQQDYQKMAVILCGYLSTFEEKIKFLNCNTQRPDRPVQMDLATAYNYKNYLAILQKYLNLFGENDPQNREKIQSLLGQLDPYYRSATERKQETFILFKGKPFEKQFTLLGPKFVAIEESSLPAATSDYKANPALDGTRVTNEEIEANLRPVPQLEGVRTISGSGLSNGFYLSDATVLDATQQHQDALKQKLAAPARSYFGFNKNSKEPTFTHQEQIKNLAAQLERNDARKKSKPLPSQRKKSPSDKEKQKDLAKPSKVKASVPREPLSRSLSGATAMSLNEDSSSSMQDDNGSFPEVKEITKDQLNGLKRLLKKNKSNIISALFQDDGAVTDLKKIEGIYKILQSDKDASAKGLHKLRPDQWPIQQSPTKFQSIAVNSPTLSRSMSLSAALNKSPSPSLSRDSTSPQSNRNSPDVNVKQSSPVSSPTLNPTVFTLNLGSPNSQSAGLTSPTGSPKKRRRSTTAQLSSELESKTKASDNKKDATNKNLKFKVSSVDKITQAEYDELAKLAGYKDSSQLTNDIQDMYSCRIRRSQNKEINDKNIISIIYEFVNNKNPSLSLSEQLSMLNKPQDSASSSSDSEDERPTKKSRTSPEPQKTQSQLRQEIKQTEQELNELLKEQQQAMQTDHTQSMQQPVQQPQQPQQVQQPQQDTAAFPYNGAMEYYQPGASNPEQYLDMPPLENPTPTQANAGQQSNNSSSQNASVPMSDQTDPPLSHPSDAQDFMSAPGVILPGIPSSMPSMPEFSQYNPGQSYSNGEMQQPMQLSQPNQSHFASMPAGLLSGQSMFVQHSNFLGPVALVPMTDQELNQEIESLLNPNY